jgi:hypothetical protein
LFWIRAKHHQRLQYEVKFLILISFFVGSKTEGNLLSSISPTLKSNLFIEDSNRYKIFFCDTTKKSLYEKYLQWCNNKKFPHYSLAVFYKRTDCWLKTADYRDGVCVHCYLSEQLVKKVGCEGVNSLSEEEKENYRSYLIHTVLLILFPFIFII